ncbi:MAG: hypothetical protein PUP91_01965 [Rhizonema sp. PD37]|nr:hypothetical protein [Rhizonema sp. PD37]
MAFTRIKPNPRYPIDPGIAGVAGSQAYYVCRVRRNIFSFYPLSIQRWAFQTDLAILVPTSPAVPF